MRISLAIAVCSPIVLFSTVAGAESISVVNCSRSPPPTLKWEPVARNRTARMPLRELSSTASRPNS